MRAIGEAGKKGSGNVPELIWPSGSHNKSDESLCAWRLSIEYNTRTFKDATFLESKIVCRDVHPSSVSCPTQYNLHEALVTERASSAILSRSAARCVSLISMPPL